MAASGAIIVELLGDQGDVIDFTVDNLVGISKGDLLQMSAGRMAIAPTSLGNIVAGIAAADKKASDGAPSVGVYRYGIFDIKVGEAVKNGELVTISNGNVAALATATDLLSRGSILGIATEDKGANDICEVIVNL